MRPVDRSEILDLGAYERIRERFRARVVEEKRGRRIALGEHMSVLFENHDTVLLQIQEMLRTERITAEKAVMHEIETYNDLIPGDRELSATIFIEYDERAEREKMLLALAGVDEEFYLDVAGERVAVTPDPRNTARDRTTAVHYTKFRLSETATAALKARGPVKIGVAHAAYSAEVELPKPLVTALAEELES